VWLEVDVHPAKAAITRDSDGFTHQPLADTGSAEVRVHGRIDDEGVTTTIPGKVDEPDQALFPIRADPGEASVQDRREITGLMRRPRRLEEIVQRGVPNVRADVKPDVSLPARHYDSVSLAAS
jgi:hypothetical protein